MECDGDGVIDVLLMARDIDKLRDSVLEELEFGSDEDSEKVAEIEGKRVTVGVGGGVRVIDLDGVST